MGGLRKEIKKGESLHLPSRVTIGSEFPPKILCPRVWVTPHGNPLTNSTTFDQLGDLTEGFTASLTRGIQNHRTSGRRSPQPCCAKLLSNPAQDIFRENFKVVRVIVALLPSTPIYALNSTETRSQVPGEVAKPSIEVQK